MPKRLSMVKAGGGRASGRLTAMNVACGAIAQLLTHYGIESVAFIRQIGPHQAEAVPESVATLEAQMPQADLWCPDAKAAEAMAAHIASLVRTAGDSWRGV